MTATWWDRLILTGYAPGARALALCRMVFAGFLLFFLMQRMDWVAEYPEVFFAPAPGLARWMPGFAPSIFLHFLNGIALICLLALFVGWYTRLVSLLFSGIFFCYLVLAQGFGKIDHILLVATFPALMAFTNWGGALSVDAIRRGKQQQVAHWPLVFLALVIGFSYFTSGVFKVMGGWLELDTQAAYGNVFMNAIANDRHLLLSDFFAELHAPFFWEMADWGIVLLDFGFLPAVLFPRIFRVWVALASFFHLQILLSMGIDFSLFAVMYMPFLAWNQLEIHAGTMVNVGTAWLRNGLRFCHPVLLVVVAVLLVGLFYRQGSLYFNLWAEVTPTVRILPGLVLLLVLSGLGIVLSALQFRRTAPNGTHRDHIDQ